jgi:hypothetical protein
MVERPPPVIPIGSKLSRALMAKEPKPKAKMLTLPDQTEVGRRGPLGRICHLLGLPSARNDLEFLGLVENGLPVESTRALASHLAMASVGRGVVDLAI